MQSRIDNDESETRHVKDKQQFDCVSMRFENDHFAYASRRQNIREERQTNSCNAAREIVGRARKKHVVDRNEYA